TAQAKQLLTQATRLTPDNNDPKEVVAEMIELGKVLGKVEAFRSMANWFNQNAGLITEKDLTLAQLIAIYNAFPEQPEELMKACRAKAAFFYQQDKADMAVLAYVYAARWLTGWGY